ncbi:MAG TPA: hypothetical protein VFM94_00545 [Solirubrobacterales bacterium]|nr:hypothetical protein [Solirubrobacterales bacterium]
MEADRQLSDAWWEALGPAALDPVRVQIIEALRWIGEPLHAIDLREIIDGVVWVVLERNLRHLKALGTVAPVDLPSRLHFFARYQLVLEQQK